jgi:hypothetical protein
MHGMPLGEGAVQAVADGIVYVFAVWRGAGKKGEAHSSPDAQEQLHAVHRQARFKRHQQQGRVSEMNKHDFRRQYRELQRGMIYVTRRVNGVDVPLRIWNQNSYKEWLGCWSAI